MSQVIKFSVRVVDNDNLPLENQQINCRKVSEVEEETIEKKTDTEGKVGFEFNCDKDCVEVDIDASGNNFNYEFRDGDFVTFKLLKDDNLNIFLELLLDKEKTRS